MEKTGGILTGTRSLTLVILGSCLDGEGTMKRHNGNVNQLSLEGLIEMPKTPALTGGSLSYGAELRAILAQALKETRMSRYEVAARMSELTGTEISKSQIDSWAAESRDGWRFPFEYAAAFEAALGTYCLTELLARKRGYKVYMGDDIRQAEIGKISAQISELNSKLAILKKGKIE